MNIENHFNNANVYLEMANEKVERQDYTGAQAALAKAYSHTRELLDHVNRLIHNSILDSQHPGENTR